MKKNQRAIIGWRPGMAAGAVLLAGILSWGGDAFGTGFVYQFNDLFSGSAPAGSAPWVDATFQNTSGGVLLTIDNAGLNAGQFLSSLYLNINPADAAKVKDLKFTFEGGSRGVRAPTIETGRNAFKADGQGDYDILFNFATTGSQTFGAGDSLTFLITGIPGLTAADFEYLSAPAGGNGTFDAAGHIQGNGCSEGGCWVDPTTCPIPVPEPGGLSILGLGAGVFGAAWLRARRKK